jgi:hypothetical protein
MGSEFSALKTQAAGSYETSVRLYITLSGHIPEGSGLHSRSRDNTYARASFSVLHTQIQARQSISET